MFLTIQYPIIDLREIIPDNYRLPKPQWPNADVKNYVRYFGKVERRKSGGVHQWPAEELYSTSWHAVNLKQLTRQKIVYDESVSSLFSCKFRRIFSNGNFLNKIELGFKTDTEKMITDGKLKEGQNGFDNIFNRVIQSFLKLEIKIKKDKEGEFDEGYLYNAGRNLAKLYLKASTGKKNKDKIESWWVKAGDPIALIIYEDSPQLKLPPYSQHVESFPEYGIRLRFVYYRIQKDKYIKIWLIGVDTSKKTIDSTTFLRQLRINLLRINAEKETLKHVLNTISAGKINIATNEDSKLIFSTYLEEITSKLLRRVRYGIEQEKILDIAIASDSTANEGDIETLLAQLAPLENKYVSKNVKILQNIFNFNEKVDVLKIETLSGAEVENKINNYNEIGTINITEKGNTNQ